MSEDGVVAFPNEKRQRAVWEYRRIKGVPSREATKEDEADPRNPFHREHPAPIHPETGED